MAPLATSRDARGIHQQKRVKRAPWGPELTNGIGGVPFGEQRALRGAA